MTTINEIVLDKSTGTLSTATPLNPQRSKLDGDWVQYDKVTDGKVTGTSRKTYYEQVEVTPTPILPLTNINIANAVLHGSIYWIAENTAMTITGDVALPDGDVMVMAERVVDASHVVDDARFIANIANGVMTMNVKFVSTGNYKFSADRLNRGLDRIGAGVHLSFDDIEFDVYV